MPSLHHIIEEICPLDQLRSKFASNDLVVQLFADWVKTMTKEHTRMSPPF